VNFHLRIDHNIVTFGLLHHLIESIVGTAGNDITNDRSRTDFGAAKQVLPVNAENASDGSFTNHLLGKGEVFKISLFL